MTAVTTGNGPLGQQSSKPCAPNGGLPGAGKLHCFLQYWCRNAKS